VSDKTKSLSTRPEKIFIYDAAIQRYGLLKAAIVGELYYWLAIEKKPFRRYQDHAVLFHVSRACAGYAHTSLTDKSNLFKRNQPRSKKHGGKLAYNYEIGSDEFCAELKDNYRSIIRNEKRKSDFGEFYAPDEPMFNLHAKTHTILTDIIDEFADLNKAYIYTRLCWFSYTAEVGSNHFSFNSIASLANLLGLNRTTLTRRLDELVELDCIEYEISVHHLSVLLHSNNQCYEIYQNWINGVNEKRTDGIQDLF